LNGLEEHQLLYDITIDYVLGLWYRIRIAKGKARTRAQQRVAGKNNAALFDIVNTATGNGSLCAPRLRTSDPPHPEGVAQRRVSKDGRPPLDLRGLMVRDAPGGAPHHEVARENPHR
jgi:hypothetical protein